jgi:UDP-N-acetylmuramoyl-tripeptide--D-alanyl-D-alanine ligase
MIRMTLEQVLDATGADLVRPPLRAQAAQIQLRGVSTDSRQVLPGSLFVGLSGPNFDGNRFGREAARAGAKALLLRADPSLSLDGLAPDVGLAVHPDPARALTDLAAWHRSRLRAKVLAITGTCGKTTTKNLAVELFSPHRRTVGSPKSFNNSIGLPLTLFQADERTELLVLEIGTSGPGEIAALARLAQPDVCIVTMVGAGHLERLGSLEGVAREKSDLPAALPAEGTFILEADGPFAPLLRSVTNAHTVGFSVEGRGEWNASELKSDGVSTRFQLRGQSYQVPLVGAHNIKNLLAVLAAGEALGLGLDRLGPGLSRLSAQQQRLERRLAGDWVLFDDTYNANPESSRAALDFLASLPRKGRRVFVLGDMLELGPLSPELHHQVGMHAARSGLDLFITVGPLAAAAAAGALEGGLRAQTLHHFTAVEAALEVVPGLLSAGDTLVIKASRGVKLERLIDRLLALGEASTAPGGAKGPCWQNC